MDQSMLFICFMIDDTTHRTSQLMLQLQECPVATELPPPSALEEGCDMPGEGVADAQLNTSWTDYPARLPEDVEAIA